jgi:hypothetical protein
MEPLLRSAFSVTPDPCLDSNRRFAFAYDDDITEENQRLFMPALRLAR